MEYRMPALCEAKALWNMMNALDYETRFMLYEPGERVRDIARIERLIESAQTGEDFLMCALQDGEIVGYLSAVRGKARRSRHVAYIVVGVRACCQGQGVGTRLFAALDGWARMNKLSRLELTVFCENERAVRLYKKQGYEVEGVRRRAMRMEDGFADEWYMAKLL